MLIQGLIWLNKRLSLAVVMLLAIWIMAFQQVQMLRTTEDREATQIAGFV